MRGLSAAYITPRQIESALAYTFGVDTQLQRRWHIFRHRGATGAHGGRWREPARIRAFFVHPEHARRGLARRLYDECAAAARAHGFSALELGATLPGQPLYQALGFVAIESLDVAMPDGEVLPVVRMTRTLSAP